MISGSTCFLLFTTSVLSQWCNKLDYNIAVLYSSSWGYDYGYYGVDVANENLKETNFFSKGQRINIIPNMVSDCNSTSLQNSINHYLTNNVTMVVGLHTSGCAKDILPLLQLNSIPFITPSSTSTILSDLPFFLRIIPSDSDQATAMMAIVKHFSWKAITVIGSDTAYGISGRSGIIDSVDAYTVDEIPLDMLTLPLWASSNRTSIVSILAQIKSNGPRAIILFTHEANGDTNMVFEEAAKMEIFGIRYLWLLSEANLNIFKTRKLSMAAFTILKGAWLVNPFPSSETYQRYEAIRTWDETYPDFSNSKDILGYYVYDAMLTCAHAIVSLEDENCPTNSSVRGLQLMNTLKHLKFTGATGNISFDGSDREFASYQVFNVHENPVEFHHVGNVDQNGKLELFSSIFWPEDQKSPPRFKTFDFAAYRVKKGHDMGHTFYAMKMAVEEISTSGLMFSNTLAMRDNLIFEDQCSAAWGRNTSIKVSQTNALAVVGNGCSSSAEGALPILEKSNLILVGGAASAITLNDPKKFPYYARVLPTSELELAIHVSIVEMYGWKTLALLYNKGDVWAEGMTEDLVHLFGTRGIYIPYRDHWEHKADILKNEVSRKVIKEIAYRLDKFAYTSILIIAQQSSVIRFLDIAFNECGLNPEKYVFLVTEAVAQSTDIFKKKYPPSMQVIGLISQPEAAQAYQQFQKKYVSYLNETKEQVLRNYTMSPIGYYYAMIFYDSVYLLANAMHQLLIEGESITHDSLMGTIQDSTFKGISGPFNYNQGSNERIGMDIFFLFLKWTPSKWLEIGMGTEVIKPYIDQIHQWPGQDKSTDIFNGTCPPALYPIINDTSTIAINPTNKKETKTSWKKLICKFCPAGKHVHPTDNCTSCPKDKDCPFGSPNPLSDTFSSELEKSHFRESGPTRVKVLTGVRLTYYYVFSALMIIFLIVGIAQFISERKQKQKVREQLETRVIWLHKIDMFWDVTRYPSTLGGCFTILWVITTIFAVIFFSHSLYYEQYKYAKVVQEGIDNFQGHYSKFDHSFYVNVIAIGTDFRELCDSMCDRSFSNGISGDFSCEQEPLHSGCAVKFEFSENQKRTLVNGSFTLSFRFPHSHAYAIHWEICSVFNKEIEYTGSDHCIGHKYNYGLADTIISKKNHSIHGFLSNPVTVKVAIRPGHLINHHFLQPDNPKTMHGYVFYFEEQTKLEEVDESNYILYPGENEEVGVALDVAFVRFSSEEKLEVVLFSESIYIFITTILSSLPAIYNLYRLLTIKGEQALGYHRHRYDCIGQKKKNCTEHNQWYTRLMHLRSSPNLVRDSLTKVDNRNNLTVVTHT